MSKNKGKRPYGLKGKEIGMYYKKLSQQRKQNSKEEAKIKLGCDVSVPPAMLDRVQGYVKLFKDGVATQVNEQRLNEDFKTQFGALISVDFDEFLDEMKKQHGNMESFDNERLDKQLLQKQEEAHELNNIFQERYRARLRLPTMAQAANIIDAVANNQVVLIVGSTGCGKTTQVPQILLDDAIGKGIGSQCRIVCTQPRRISAITVAERVSYERAEKIGKSVGYQIRLEACKPRERASITYCTTGVLLHQLQSDPLMHNTSVLILDEIHERSVETDLLMGLLKLILPHRPALKVILMSATVREQDFCDYFDQCPMFHIDGVMFPVQMLYLEDVLELTGYQFDSKREKRAKSAAEQAEHRAMIEPYIRRVRGNFDKRVLEQLRLPESEGCDIDFVSHLIYHICSREAEGAILVFMPGYDKISQLHSILEKPRTALGQHWKDHLQLYTLHSMLPSVEQQAVFGRVPRGKRKVIISTIIAETSVTIDDVVYVINTGRTKVSSYDTETNIQALEEAWVTKANTQQRRGRAGRVQPGICYNLFSRAREERMPEMPTPEILRSKLESILLSLKLMHIEDPYGFLQTLINPPAKEAISNGLALLKRIEALDSAGLLTPLGMHLAKMPIDPQMGKMMLMSTLFRCWDPISSAAAALSYKSPFYTPIGLERRVDETKRRLACNMRSDHLCLHNTICAYRECGRAQRQRDFCYNNFLSFMTLQQLERMKQQFAQLLHNYKFLSSSDCQHDKSNSNSENVSLVRAIIGAGLYPNMAHLHKARQIRNQVRTVHSMTTDDGRHVNFHPSSVNSGEASFESNYFVYYQRQKSSALYLLDATMVFSPARTPQVSLTLVSMIRVPPTRVDYVMYRVRCEPEVRDRLEAPCLLKKALYPAPVDENSHENELIRAIELLLSLDEGMGDEYSDDIDNI
ncbi:LOW QUALITY PROTEIN: ATP-dependent DNA/RNA helicase DHX36 [Drosophila busckii]|uniref:LOW QUALITY PROTEIN: ATP-dependent DNA/RNA helicase DHX36 n=1 Tax=Drosophila busckii TaxID=30019 RepID=UPI001432E391|nr:LOW QUALITY PROTEIN: ATP-dependent DNA/RNA helicase DHX36 [Drosophila busckii]